MMDSALMRYGNLVPTVGRRVFVAPGARVIGDVTLGDDASVWFNAVVRGDIHWVRLGARSNLQDGVVVHVEHGSCPTSLDEEVSVGHGAVLHGCRIGRGALIGMGATVLNDAVVGEGALVAAGSVVREGFTVPRRTLVAGVPAEVRRELTADESKRIEASWRHYLEYKARYLADGAGVVEEARS